MPCALEAFRTTLGRARCKQPSRVEQMKRSLSLPEMELAGRFPAKEPAGTHWMAPFPEKGNAAKSGAAAPITDSRHVRSMQNATLVSGLCAEWRVVVVTMRTGKRAKKAHHAATLRKVSGIGMWIIPGLA